VAAKEIEIATLTRLKDVLSKQLSIAARVLGFPWAPASAASFDLGLVDEQIEPTRTDVDPDAITVLDQREGTADGRLRCDV
jgi:hypothetical protein